MTIIQSNSNSPDFNLGTEEYLFSRRLDDILFLYVNEPCVVIGRNQEVELEVDIEYCSLNDIPVFKRISGGGAVYHDRGNLNYCFISNRINGESPLKADFLQPIVKVLTELQIEVKIGKRNDLWLPGGHKISGTASHVSKTRELHHGTLLYDSDLNKLEKSLSPKSVEQKLRAIFSVSSPVENIRSYLIERNHFAPEANYFFGLFAQKLVELYNLESVSKLCKEETSVIKLIYSLI